MDTTGNSHRFFVTYVSGLRLVTSVAFFLSSVLAGIQASAPGVAAGLLLTLASATSFLVDIRDHLKSDGEKSQHSIERAWATKLSRLTGQSDMSQL